MGDTNSGGPSRGQRIAPRVLPSRAELVRYGLRATLLFVVLTALPLFGELYASLFIAEANGVLALLGLDGLFTMAPMAPPTEMADVVVRVRPPGTSQVTLHPGSSRSHGFLDTAFVLALVLGTTLPLGRRIVATLGAVAAVQLFVVARYALATVLHAAQAYPAAVSLPRWLAPWGGAAEDAFFSNNLESGLLFGMAAALVAVVLVSARPSAPPPPHALAPVPDHVPLWTPPHPELWLVGVAIAVYLVTLGHGWALDDVALRVDNPRVLAGLDGLTPLFTSSVWKGLGHFYPLQYRPLPLATFALEHAVVGASPAVAHAVQVTLYATTVGCVWLFSRALWRRPDLAWWSTLLFAVHPVHVEVVANVANRGLLLALLFGALTGYAVLRATRSDQAGWPALAGVCFGMALLSDASALAIGLAVPVLALGWHRVPPRRVAHAASPMAPALLLWLALRHQALGQVFPTTAPAMLTPLQNLLFAADGTVETVGTWLGLLGRSVGLLAWPSPLLYDRSLGLLYPEPWWSPVSLATAAVALALFLAAPRLPRGAQAGLAWAAITWLPASNLVRWAVGSSLRDRDLFAPSLGIAWCVVSLMALSAPAWRRHTHVAAGAVVLLLSATTVTRASWWVDTLTLVTHDQLAAPQSPRILDDYRTLAARAAVQHPPSSPERERSLGPIEEAARRSRAIYRTEPERRSDLGAVSMYTMAFLQSLRGDRTGAEPLLREVLVLEPNHTGAMARLGLARLAAGDADGASRWLEQAIAVRTRGEGSRPDAFPLAELHARHCLALGQTGEFLPALAACTRAVQLDPQLATAWAGMAVAHQGRGDDAAAERALTRAKRLDPTRFGAH